MRTRDNGNNFKKKTYFEQYCLLRVILHFGPYKSMHQMYFKTILLSTTCISQFLENESLIFFSSESDFDIMGGCCTFEEDF